MNFDYIPATFFEGYPEMSTFFVVIIIITFVGIITGGTLLTLFLAKRLKNEQRAGVGMAASMTFIMLAIVLVVSTPAYISAQFKAMSHAGEERLNKVVIAEIYDTYGVEILENEAEELTEGLVVDPEDRKGAIFVEYGSTTILVDDKLVDVQLVSLKDRFKLAYLDENTTPTDFIELEKLK